MSTTLEQLRQLVREMPGRKMPGERDLASTLGVGRKQVRAALAALAAEGLIRRHQGSGTFAAEAPKLNRETPSPPVSVGMGRNECPTSLTGWVPKSMTSALLVDATLRLGDDPFFSLLVDKIQRALQIAGIRCLVERIDRLSPNPATLETPSPPVSGEVARNEPGWVLPAVDAFLTVGLAGEAVLGSAPDVPMVCFFLPETSFRRGRSTLLTLDDRFAGAMAAEGLIERGCASLIFAGMNDLPMSRLRLAGAHRAAQMASVPIRGIRSGSNFRSGLLLARSLAADPDHPPAGVIAANDWMAVGIQAGLMSRGLLTGDARYLIAGFDGLDIAADPALAIDSVMFPLDAIVDDAVAELFRLSSSSHVRGRLIRYAPEWRL